MKPTFGKPVCRVGMRWQAIGKAEAFRLGLDVRSIPRRESHLYGLVQLEGAWLEIPLHHEWMAAYRLVMQDGQPVIAEFRAFPLQEGKRHPGEWRGSWRGLKATVPRGGLTARFLHNQIRPGQVSAQLSMILQNIEDRYGKTALDPDGTWLGLAAPSRKQTVGRKARPDHEYASIARDYVNALQSHSKKPIETIAKARHLSVQQARDLVHRARVRGFLSKATKQGRAGGALMAKAKVVLDPPTATKRRRKDGTKR